MLRNRDYGQPRTCEYPSCSRTRGAPKHSIYHYGCVLCTYHGNELQLGNISLPDTASDERKREVREEILG